MARRSIPTARFEVCSDEASALDAVSGERCGFPVVVKADGLAAGKGVTVAPDREAAVAAVRGAMIEGRFGAAGTTLVIEECLTGPEVSCFVVCDGRRGLALPPAQDYKRAYDDDAGPNTGGMGAFAPSPLVGPDLAARIEREIIAPTIDGLRDEGCEYRGVLYAGLMLTDDGPKVIEFNVRFGDPEAQVILPMVKSGLARVLHAAASGELGDATWRVADDPHVGVVMASGGYPRFVQDRIADQRARRCGGPRRGSHLPCGDPHRRGGQHRDERWPRADRRGTWRALEGSGGARVRGRGTNRVRRELRTYGHRAESVRPGAGAEGTAWLNDGYRS